MFFSQGLVSASAAMLKATMVALQSAVASSSVKNKHSDTPVTPARAGACAMTQPGDDDAAKTRCYSPSRALLLPGQT